MSETEVHDTAKRAAAAAAVELVEDGMRLGLGTGSTVAYLLEDLAGRRVVGVPTSEATAARCAQLGIPLATPDDVDRLDLAIDGADELDRSLALTKGGGGALLREKVVAAMADRFVVIATHDKLVDRLGVGFPVPIEVVPFARGPVERALIAFGFEVALRGGPATPVYTDNGNVLLDATMPGGIDDPAVMDVAIAVLPGVAETGLFIDLADTALLGDDTGRVTRLSRSTDGQPSG